MDSRQIREVQGPGIGHPFEEGFHIRKEDRIEEVIANGIVFTISSRLDLANPANARRITELLHLAKHDSIDIDLAPTSKVEIPNRAGGIGRITLDEQKEYFVLTTMRNPDSQRGIDKPVQFEMLENWFDFTPEQANILALEILAHRELGNEVFITDDKKLIADRYSHGYLKDVGIHSIEEACEKAGVVVRRSGHYPVGNIPHVNVLFDAGLTYLKIARLLMPNVEKAFSNALSPSNRDTMRDASTYIDTIFGHCIHLLMALDEMAVWHWRDVYLGGNNNLLEHQMYHFQYLLMLSSAILETLAWVLVELDHVKPSRYEVGFRIVVKVKEEWVKELQTAKPIADFIHQDQRSAELLTTMELRHLVAHREGLSSMTGSVVKILDMDRMIFDEEIKYGMILVDLNEIALAENQRGTIRQDADCHIIPYVYARYLVFTLANYLDDAFSKVEWPEADWIDKSPDRNSHLKLSESQEAQLIDMLGR